MSETNFPRCETCSYMDEGESPAIPISDDRRQLGQWLLCRRYPPVVLSKANDGYAGGTAVFPRVDRKDWCGEWVQSSINSNDRRQKTFLFNELDIFDEMKAEEVDP
jgi:hypothetical protein